MSDLNLNDPNQFAALTSAFGSAFGAPAQQIWNIAQSSFKGVPFHIFSGSAQSSPTDPSNIRGPGALAGPLSGNTLSQGIPANYSAGVPRVHDRTGRRKIFYQFPFKDGQTSGDLGRTPFTFEFDIVFFGPNYFSGYTNFYNVLNQPDPGYLIHPVLGNIRVVPGEWEVTHENSERLALTMRVTFHEHTYDQKLPFKDGGIIRPTSTGDVSTLKSLVISALSVFQTVNATTTAIREQVGYTKSFINGSINLVNGMKSQYLLALQGLYLSFSPVSISLSPDLPGVLPVNLGGQVTPKGTTQSSLYPLTNASTSPFSSVSTASSSNPTTLTPVTAQASVNAVLAQIEALVSRLNSSNSGQGALDFYNEVLTYKQAAIALQKVCISAVASSNNQTTQYTTPPEVPYMSIREVAFAIGLDVDSSDQIRTLNPEILSVNNIPGGTMLNIPVISA